MTQAFSRLQRGTRIGKYRLESHVASGGFAEVWKARDTVERAWVALKIPPNLNSEEEQLFLEEIRLSAMFEHPNILRIRNADRIHGRYVIASDLAIESLDERLTRRIGARRALSYTRQILAGLTHAHQHRVIHRDLKPSNLMLFSGDRLKIADFGLAKVAMRTMISATGSGTLLYLAPEQAHGYPCFASDVFSVGLIVYQMLTGYLPHWPFEWPFEGHDTLRSKVPEVFGNWLRKATRPEHHRRFRTAPEMLGAFDRMESAIRRFESRKKRQSAGARHSRNRSRRRRRPVVGAWREVRFREFERAYGKKLFLRFHCPDCGGPISEHMSNCPWCGAGGLHLGEDTEFPHYCARCRRGIRDEWHYCPWCWGPGFDGADGEVRPDPRYRGSCRACRGPMIEGMQYCPWCHTKNTRPIRVEELAHRCSRCRGSTHREYWGFCPWCGAAQATQNGAP